MQRITSVEPQSATGRTHDLFQTVQGVFEMVPNVAKVMAHSPAVLDGFLAFSAAMAQASIGGKLHHQIKQATSEANACDYCKSVLTALGPAGGLSDAELLAGRSAQSPDARTDAALKFARAVLQTQGKVSDNDLAAARAGSLNDADLVEVVASVVLGCFTNFLNNVADTKLDVPRVEPLAA